MLADLRARPAALPRILTTLSELDFEVELAAPDESGHRFKRGDVTIDLLAPDNLGDPVGVLRLTRTSNRDGVRCSPAGG